MNKKLFNILVGLTLILGLTACSQGKPKNSRTDTYSSGEITFYSDESFSPIIKEQLDVFHHMYLDAKVTPIYTNEIDAIDSLINEKTHLAITTRKYRNDELEYLRSRRYLPMIVPLAYDGLALIVTNSNPDTLITINDLRKILKGEATKWTDIYPSSKLGDFDVVFDNPKSSTVQYCVDSILGGVPINSPHITAVNKSAEVIDYVSNTKNAIGVIGSNWLNDKRDTTNVTFKKNITVMSVSRMDKATRYNSWKPYQYYLYNGNYPMIRTIYALLNDPINGLPWGFAQFIASPRQGQLIIFKSGLLPVTGNMTVRNINVEDN